VVLIRHLFVSPGHSYRGRHGGPAADHPIVEVDRVECVAGRGIVGDRYFDHAPDFKGQITFFSWEVLLALWEELGVPQDRRDPSATRRNAIVEGADLNALIGAEFEIGGLRFLGTEECRPCYWMNGAIHPEAEAWMRGRGGLRAKILRGGFLERSAPKAVDGGNA
jgi:MOSC domain-containing protein YiiM